MVMKSCTHSLSTVQLKQCGLFFLCISLYVQNIEKQNRQCSFMRCLKEYVNCNDMSRDFVTFGFVSIEVCDSESSVGRKKKSLVCLSVRS
jgi:hypothetical protein